VEFLTSKNRGSDAISRGVAAGTLLEFIPMHVKNPPRITFMAFLETLSDTYGVEYSDLDAWGRSDPMFIWKKSPRTIKLVWSVLSSGKEMALKNLFSLQWFLASLYPTYKEVAGAQSNSVAASPLHRIKFANLIMGGRSDSGLLATLSQITVTPELKKNGFISCDFGPAAPELREAAEQVFGDITVFKEAIGENNVPAGHLLIPQKFKISLTAKVVHSESLGWDSTTGEWRSKDGTFPYGIALKKTIPAAPPADVCSAGDDGTADVCTNQAAAASEIFGN
jgi:hypothetical protein